MPARMIPNVSHWEKHLAGYAPCLRKQHYKHFKGCILGILEGTTSMAEICRRSGTPDRTLRHFSHEAHFDDLSLLEKSVSVMNHHSQTRSTSQALVILDFTSTFKTGKSFEWADWLWDEETDQPNKRGHEQVVALEVDPEKDFRKVLGFRRFYHQEMLLQTEYSMG